MRFTPAPFTQPTTHMLILNQNSLMLDKELGISQ